MRLCIIIFVCMSRIMASGQTGHDNQDARTLLLKVHTRLNSLQNIRFTQSRELNYPAEKYKALSEWNVYYDLTKADSVVGTVYQVSSEDWTQIYNGTELITLENKDHTMQVTPRPAREKFDASSFFYNSLLTFRSIIPAVLADTKNTVSLTDTTIANQRRSLVTINLHKSRIRNLGKGFDAMTTTSNIIYKILIDLATNLPVEVRQVNDADENFIRTAFTNIQIDGTPVADDTWFYSSYAAGYTLARPKDLPQLIGVNVVAPDWTLPYYNRNESLSPARVQGKVVLLDFFIKNCTPCIKSIPDLNEIKTRFAGKSFELIGINAYDPPEDIVWFCNKYKPGYPILKDGKMLAEKYGITGYPTMVLIGKDGRVIYAGNGLVKEELATMIGKAL